MNSAIFAGGRVFALLALSVILSSSATDAATFTITRAVPQMVTATAVAAATETQTRGIVSPDKKSLTFSQTAIRLVVQTGPETDMLSYRIAELRNPTLMLPSGATLKILFVNSDDDMNHDIRFGAAQKSYPNVMDALLKASIGTPPLPHKGTAAYSAEELTLRVPTVPGTYAYFCTVRGHAQGGMCGNIIVR